MEQQELDQHERELTLSGMHPDAVDAEMARHYPQATDVRAYEDWYFDRDPDKWERLAEEAEATALRVAEGSPYFDYGHRCAECAAYHKHHVGDHIDLVTQVVIAERAKWLAEEPEPHVCGPLCQDAMGCLEEHPF